MTRGECFLVGVAAGIVLVWLVEAVGRVTLVAEVEQHLRDVNHED